MSAKTRETETKVRPYRMSKPCPKCPFRSDIPKYLRPERAQQIADSLYDGAEFPCHQTTEEVEDEDGMGERVATAKSAACAGALITMEKEGFSNQMVRIAERLGMYDHQALDMEAPVYGSLSEWVASYRETKTVEVTFNGVTETLEYEHCGVVAQDCEDPPGYMMGGGVAESTDEPTCHPVDDCCVLCGSPVCSTCRAGLYEPDNPSSPPVCVYCVEDSDDDTGEE